VRAIEVSERLKKKLLRGAVQQVFRRNPTGATYSLVGFDLLIGNVDMVVLGLWNVMNSGGNAGVSGRRAEARFPSVDQEQFHSVQPTLVEVTPLALWKISLTHRSHRDCL
jgi:hypothetical protein